MAANNSNSTNCIMLASDEKQTRPENLCSTAPARHAPKGKHQSSQERSYWHYPYRRPRPTQFPRHWCRGCDASCGCESWEDFLSASRPMRSRPRAMAACSLPFSFLCRPLYAPKCRPAARWFEAILPRSRFMPPRSNVATCRFAAMPAKLASIRTKNGKIVLIAVDERP